MIGVCPSCETRVTVPGGQGRKITDCECPTCRVGLRGPGAGVTRTRYRCPLSGETFTFPAKGRRLDTAHLVGFVELPDMARLPAAVLDRYPGWRKLHGVVLGAGAVVKWPDRPNAWWPLRLTPIPAGQAGDPAAHVVNQPVRTTRTVV